LGKGSYINILFELLLFPTLRGPFKRLFWDFNLPFFFWGHYPKFLISLKKAFSLKVEIPSFNLLGRFICQIWGFFFEGFKTLLY